MYSLDTQSARKSDSLGGMITELGKYVGKITQAYEVIADTGTKGVGFSFESRGQKANFTLYTIKSNGDKIMGYDALMSMMTVLNLRDIKPVAGKIKGYDYDAKQEIMRDGKVFPELANKDIGILFETEDYLSKTGEEKSRVVPRAFFQANTELMASEILDRKTEPTMLPRFIDRLRHKPLKKSAQAAQPTSSTQSKPSTSFDDMDDDIPF